ncbi:MAG: efflux RND transporter periplasmic adaptor subunit [Deltaproteobacteria bacterium]|nr:efflux RND transporter periplasmic adaptor subunit [Deltaproteobacteria bacterium]
MKRNRLLLLLAAAALSGCSAGGTESKKAPEGAPAMPPVAVEVAAAVARDVSDGVDVVGTLEPKFETTVKTEVPGPVTEVAVTQWVRVRKGQVLARVDTRELHASLERARAGVESARAAEEATRAGLLEAGVAVDRAERELERNRKLREAGLATQQGLDDAESARDAARARVAAVKSQISAAAAQVAAAREDVRQIETRIAKAVVYSPLDGVVSERTVNVGDIPGDKPIFRIVDNRLLNLTVTVPSKEMARIRVGQPVAFATDALPGRSFEGRVMFVNPAVDAADRSVKVVAEVPNGSEQLKGGLFVKGRITTGRRSGVLLVARSALVAWDVASRRGELFVVEGASARKRSVEIGAAEGDGVEVAKGLSPGDKVVVRGGFNLKDGDAVRVSAAAPAKAPAPAPAGT